MSWVVEETDEPDIHSNCTDLLGVQRLTNSCEGVPTQSFLSRNKNFMETKIGRIGLYT
jgi:hypothetical protein